eukprot:3033895-Amphidinium_carterae.1
MPASTQEVNKSRVNRHQENTYPIAAMGPNGNPKRPHPPGGGLGASRPSCAETRAAARGPAFACPILLPFGDRPIAPFGATLPLGTAFGGQAERHTGSIQEPTTQGMKHQPFQEGMCSLCPYLMEMRSPQTYGSLTD